MNIFSWELWSPSVSGTCAPSSMSGGGDNGGRTSLLGLLSLCDMIPASDAEEISGRNG